MSGARPPVAVVGGGLAGLTAARAFADHGVPFELFEASPRLAGLAGSTSTEDGYTHQFGVHFITNRLAAGLGVGASCRRVPRYGESVWLDGRPWSYPLGLMARPRYDLSAVAARVAGILRGGEPPRDAASFFRRAYGRALADEVALPLLRAWSGEDPADLSPAVGAGLPVTWRTVLLRLGARLTARPVAVGFCRSLPDSPHVWHVSVDGGIGTVCDRMAEGIEPSIHLSTPVQKIYVENEHVVGIRAGDRDRAVSAVVSTAPIHMLPNLVEGSRRVERFRAFRFRPMIFVDLRLEGRGLLPDVITWLPGGEHLAFRLTEGPLSMPSLAPPGYTLVTADIGCDDGDEVWKMSDDELARRSLADLEHVCPDAHRRHVGHRVLRTKVAYPVFHRDYEEERCALATSGTGVEGLLSVGRNGEFARLLMEDVHCQTLASVRPLVEGWRAGGPPATARRMRGKDLGVAALAIASPPG